MISRIVQSNLAPAWSRYRQVLWGSAGVLNGTWCGKLFISLNLHMVSLLRQSSCSGMWTAGWDCAKLSLNKRIRTFSCCVFKSMVHDVVSLAISFFWRAFMSFHVGLRIAGSRLHIIRWKMMNTMAQVRHCWQNFDLIDTAENALAGPLLPDSVPWLHRKKVDRPEKNAGFYRSWSFS